MNLCFDELFGSRRLGRLNEPSLPCRSQDVFWHRYDDVNAWLHSRWSKIFHRYRCPGVLLQSVFWWVLNPYGTYDILASSLKFFLYGMFSSDVHFSYGSALCPYTFFSWVQARNFYRHRNLSMVSYKAFLIWNFLSFHTGASHVGSLFFRCARKLSISIFLQTNHLLYGIISTESSSAALLFHSYIEGFFILLYMISHIENVFFSLRESWS